jgi:hypothetical protein
LAYEITCIYAFLSRFVCQICHARSMHNAATRVYTPNRSPASTPELQLYSSQHCSILKRTVFYKLSLQT